MLMFRLVTSGAAILCIELASATPAGGQLAPPPAFRPCASCHGVSPDARSTLGPNLSGVGKRVAGTLPGFNYSPAMKRSNIKWTRESLLKFIKDPSATVPGTRMGAVSPKSPRDQAAIADYLLSLP